MLKCIDVKNFEIYYKYVNFPTKFLIKILSINIFNFDIKLIYFRFYLVILKKIKKKYSIVKKVNNSYVSMIGQR